MPDTKQLDFSGGDPDFLAVAQKQQMAQALAQAILKAQGGSFRKSPVAAVLDILTSQRAKGAFDAASAEQLDLLRQRRAVEDQEKQQFLTAIGQGDPRAAIAQALASRFPSVNKLGETYQKDNTTAFGNVLTALKDRLTPESVISSAGGGGYAGGLQPSAPPASPSLRTVLDAGGKPRSWIEALNPNGQYQVHPLNDPMQVSASATNAARKPGYEVIEQQGKYYAAGGKGYDLGQKLQGQLSQSMDLIRTLNENPQMGAGADALQTLRKWTETLGGQPIQLTGTTDQMKSQLAKHVIDTLGTLGNQVSNQDVKIMQDAIGSIDMNPGALRRVVLTAMKYQMRALSTLENQAQELSRNPSLEGVTFPGYTFNTEFPTGQDADEFEQILRGKLPQLRLPGQQPPPVSRIRPRN